MNAYAGTRSTRTLNPEAANWHDEIDGEFIPSITLYNVEDDVLPIFLTALKEAAKRAGSLADMATLAQIGADLEKARRDSQIKAEEANQKAEETFKTWKAAQEAQKAASEESEE